MQIHNLHNSFHIEVGAHVVVVVLSQDIFVGFPPVGLLLCHGQGSDVLVLETSVAFGGICVVVASRTCGAFRQFGNKPSTRIVLSCWFEGTCRVTMQDRTPWQEHLRSGSGKFTLSFWAARVQDGGCGLGATVGLVTVTGPKHGLSFASCRARS